MAASPTSRLAYIDWMRGLACVLMFQTHCYDSWLSPEARKSTFFMYSQLGGTLPAPLFLFLAGISFALVTGKLLDKGVASREMALTTLRRGAEIFGLGLLFRLQEFLIAWPWAPWSDLLRVDVLNTIGISMMLMALVCWAVAAFPNLTRARLTVVALFTACAISLLTPLLWTTWSPQFLPWPIESYINGVHNLGEPQPWLFPIFPWTAFAFAGLGAGFLLTNAWSRVNPTKSAALAGLAGAALMLVIHATDAPLERIYPDYWHTSPAFWMMRVGILLVILFGVYAWCQWGWGQWGFSPLIQLGRTSLLVYWVHIEFVYGRLSFLPKHANSIRTASLGLLIIFLSMLLLSRLRTELKRSHMMNWVKKAAA